LHGWLRQLLQQRFGLLEIELSEFWRSTFISDGYGRPVIERHTWGLLVATDPEATEHLWTLILPV
jgi:hypothetical protein